MAGSEVAPAAKWGAGGVVAATRTGKKPKAPAGRGRAAGQAPEPQNLPKRAKIWPKSGQNGAKI